MDSYFAHLSVIVNSLHKYRPKALEFLKRGQFTPSDRFKKSCLDQRDGTVGRVLALHLPGSILITLYSLPSPARSQPCALMGMASKQTNKCHREIGCTFGGGHTQLFPDLLLVYFQLLRELGTPVVLGLG